MQDLSQFILRYADGRVRLSPDVEYNLQDVIFSNIKNFNRQFEEPYYADKTKKLFYPLSYIMARTLFENTDIDTKDMNLRAENPQSVDIAALIKPALKQYLKDYDYGEDLNLIRQELINMGHVIVKEVNNESKIVDLRNIIRPPHMMGIQDGSFVEKVLMTWEDMLESKTAWEEHWDLVEEIHEVMIGTTTPIIDGETIKGQSTSKGRKLPVSGGSETTYFVVYEYWTRDNFKVGGKELFTKGVIKYLDTMILRPDDNQDAFNWTPQIELERFASPESARIKNQKRLKEFKKLGLTVNGDEERIYPYEEQRLVTVPGRWLGVGVYELTTPMQEQFNEILNDKRRMDQLVHKGILVHRQPSNGDSSGLTQEFINSLSTGAIISVEQDEDLTRLNLGSMTIDFIASADKIFELARQAAGVTASGTGEELPASTTATVAVANQQKAKTTFDIIIEQQALFFERLFERFKLKSILSNMTTEEWIQLSGDPMELNAIEEQYIRNYAHNQVNEAIKRGEFVQEGEIDQLIEVIKSQREGKPRFVQIIDEMIKNLRFTVEFFVSNESFDKLNRIRELQQAIQNAIQDPNNTLSITRLQQEVLDLLNLSGSRFKMTQQEIQQKQENEQRMAMLQSKGVGSMQSNPTVLNEGQRFGNNNATA
jgi:hypothetical protein